jgi:hypothetical protein
MGTEKYLQQLEKKFPDYLKSIIKNETIFPFELRGGKEKPLSLPIFNEVIQSFLANEKTNSKCGWTIEWKEWKDKKFGDQARPSKVTIETEADFLHLLQKEKEVLKFKQLLQQLIDWSPAIQNWLVENHIKILSEENSWKGICDVVNYLLQNDVSDYYLRSLPVPVHTKFIGQHEATILSMLKYLSPERFSLEVKSLEEALALKSKQFLFTVKWLDDALAKSYNIDLEIMGITLSGLQQLDNNVKEIWLVENETNLYLVPKRKNALAICSRGFAVNLLKDIPLFEKVKLFYWGDLDMHGFTILHQCRAIYHHVTSVMMDVETITFHRSEYQLIDTKIISSNLPLLHPNEMKAFEILYPHGRIEQEKLNQQYIHHYIQNLTEVN